LCNRQKENYFGNLRTNYKEVIPKEKDTVKGKPDWKFDLCEKRTKTIKQDG
jgi:hypothetical protein